MAKRIEIFENGYKGLADSRWSGVRGSVAEAVGIDAHSTPGILKVHQKLSLHSGNLIDELCYAAVNVSDGSRLWFSSESGKIWREVNGVYTHVYTNVFPARESWWIENMSYTGKQLETQSAETAWSISISSDGTRLITISDDTLRTYSLSTPFDINTATFLSSFSTNTQTSTTASGLWVNSTGTRVLVSSAIGTGTIFQYNLSDPFNVSSATYSGTSFVHGKDFAVFTLGDSESKMYLTPLVGSDAGKVFQYTLSTPGNVSTASLTSTTDTLPLIPSGVNNVVGIAVSTTGTSLILLYTTGGVNAGLYRFSMATPWNSTTITYNNKRKTFNENGAPRRTDTGLGISADGKYVYMGHQNLGGPSPKVPTIYQFEVDIVSEDFEINNVSAVEHAENIYWTTKNQIQRIPVADLSNFTNNVQFVATFKNGSEKHPIAIFDDELFIADDKTIATVNEFGNVFLDSDFNIVAPETITALTVYDTDILVGTHNGNTGRVLRWDTFGDSASAIDVVYEKGIRAFVHDDNFVYVIAGDQGKIYFYNGEKLELVRRLRGNFNKTNRATVNDTSVGYWNGLPMFALSTEDGTPCKMGLYTFGSHSPGYSRILDLAFPINDTYNDIVFGAIIVDGLDLYVSTTSGVYKLDHNNKYEYAHIETKQLSPRGDKYTYKKYIVDYISLPTAINVSYRGKYGQPFSLINKNIHDTRRQQIRAEITDAEVTSLQLRYDLVADGNDAPEIEACGIE